MRTLHVVYKPFKPGLQCWQLFWGVSQHRHIPPAGCVLLCPASLQRSSAIHSTPCLCSLQTDAVQSYCQSLGLCCKQFRNSVVWEGQSPCEEAADVSGNAWGLQSSMHTSEAWQRQVPFLLWEHAVEITFCSLGNLRMIEFNWVARFCFIWFISTFTMNIHELQQSDIFKLNW